MYYSKVRNVKSPKRANSDDAGIDFYVPKFDESFIKDFQNRNPHLQIDSAINIAPLESVEIPSGIHVNLKRTKFNLGWSGIMLCAHNKSGVATKRSLVYTAHVVDEGYMGEIIICLKNNSNNYAQICEDDKIIQFCIEEVSYIEPIEVEFSDLYIGTSSRGINGFDSTKHI